MAVFLEQPGDPPSAARQFELNAFVLHQVFQRLRCASLFQIVGRRDHHQFCILQQARDHGRVRLGADADRQIVAFADKVDIAVAQVDVDGDVRVERAEFW
ncbi:hypothetical protein D3C81_1611470 [compost metagenome]